MNTTFDPYARNVARETLHGHLGPYARNRVREILHGHRGLLDSIEPEDETVPGADLRAALQASLARTIEELDRRDSLPCPSCGGDRLRPDFTGSGACHVPHPTRKG